MTDPCWQNIHRYILKRSEPFKTFHSAVTKNGILTLKQTQYPDLFTFMCRQVVSQQLSTRSAIAIWNRVLHQCNGGLELKDLCNGEHYSKLRQCGLSRNKVRAIQELRLSFIKDEINIFKVKNLSPQEIKKASEQLLGIWRVVCRNASTFLSTELRHMVME